MKLLNLSQREPVAFDGNGILLRENRICFSLSEFEKQINKENWVDIIPPQLSIRNLVLFDFLLLRKYISRYEHYVVLEKKLQHDRSYKAVFDQNGCFVCCRFKFCFPKYRSDLSLEDGNKISWINYQWTLDNQGNHLLQVDYLTRHKKTYQPTLVLREFVSIKDQSIVRRKLSYEDLILLKIETDLYNDENGWILTNGKDFPAEHWKKVDKIYTHFP